jgi:hypothetical protein
MAPIKNLAWLRKQLSRKLNFNATQTDQDFAGPASDANDVIDTYLSEAYSREVNAAKIELGFRPFSLTASLTWTASEQTLTVPQYLIDQQMIRIDDETDGVPGNPLWIGTEGQGTVIRWRDKNTLQWGDVGPGSDRTLTVFYVAAAEALTDPLSEPVLIPPDHRWLLIWQAAIIARAEADEGAPNEWKFQHAECRSQYHHLLGQGVITSPLSYTIKDRSIAASNDGASTTAGIGGGIG